MKTPKEKAVEMIFDFVEMMPSGKEPLKNQYELAKIQAKYCTVITKWSHDKGTEKFIYWLDVQNEIEKL